MGTVLLRNKIGASVLLAVSFALVGPPAQDAVDAAPGDMRSLINAERLVSGRRVLRSSWRLARIARRHSLRMANQNNLYHNPRLAYEARRMSWTVLGENVGVGTSVDSLHRAFMNSAPHRRNVLNGRFRRVGIGGVYSNGRLWVTVVFAN